MDKEEKVCLLCLSIVAIAGVIAMILVEHSFSPAQNTAGQAAMWCINYTYCVAWSNGVCTMFVTTRICGNSDGATGGRLGFSIPF